MKKQLLCICYEFAPQTTPTAIRTQKLLKPLQDEWNITVITAQGNVAIRANQTAYPVAEWPGIGLITWLNRIKMEKLASWLTWPDDRLFWIVPALWRAWMLARRLKPDAIVVFMMPYSAGIVGLWLKKLTGLPLVLNLDDSLTCTDMHPASPSRLHHWLTRSLENTYARCAEATIYVSEFNRRAVQQRLPLRDKQKLHLIRYGADPTDFATLLTEKASLEEFNIVYVGGMSGWYEFYRRPEEMSWAQKLYKSWMRWGQKIHVHLDQRGSSPYFIGKAVQAAIAENRDWHDRINVNISGNRYPATVVDRVLANIQICDVVSVFGSVAHAEAIQLARQADLLFLTLPSRKDGSPGGRISAKTYEYLMTDRPILAAVPRGESWDYLQDKPGVWLVESTDIEGMTRAIMKIAKSHFSGVPLRIDRSHLHNELSYASRAQELNGMLKRVLAEKCQTNNAPVYTSGTA